MKRVYLAGGRSSDWRTQLEARWQGLAVCFDPFRDSAQGSVAEFTGDDLAAVRSADLVFGNLDYPVAYTGLALEFGYAHALRIPVIYLHSAGPRVDSMMAGVAAGIFTDLEAAAEFAERRFL